MSNEQTALIPAEALQAITVSQGLDTLEAEADAIAKMFQGYAVTSNDAHAAADEDRAFIKAAIVKAKAFKSQVLDPVKAAVDAFNARYKPAETALDVALKTVDGATLMYENQVAAERQRLEREEAERIRKEREEREAKARDEARAAQAKREEAERIAREATDADARAAAQRELEAAQDAEQHATELAHAVESAPMERVQLVAAPELPKSTTTTTVQTWDAWPEVDEPTTIRLIAKQAQTDLSMLAYLSLDMAAVRRVVKAQKQLCNIPGISIGTKAHKASKPGR